MDSPEGNAEGRGAVPDATHLFADQAFHRVPGVFERTARPMVQEDRLTAIRYALAAQLDISVSRLSSDPADYPASKFNKLFLDRVINRFTVEGSEYLTYHEALRPVTRGGP